MRIAARDFISKSYFPAIAAVELGCFRDEGIEATVELLFPVDAVYHDRRRKQASRSFHAAQR